MQTQREIREQSKNAVWLFVMPNETYDRGRMPSV